MFNSWNHRNRASADLPHLPIRNSIACFCLAESSCFLLNQFLCTFGQSVFKQSIVKDTASTNSVPHCLQETWIGKLQKHLAG
jgi:hypothetical protein